ncbi:MAG: PQQ-binding-like beta-propeller repeat protein [Ignavibacteriaceae bacterium]|nr:PQQ-binding-like beta-propeller repeat protein [Ignavibacteriaceae bacterium]
MNIRSFTKLIVSIFISLNIQVFAKNTFIDHNLIDSTIQKQDSYLQKIGEIDSQSSSSTNLIVTENKIYTTTDEGFVYCYFMDGIEKFFTELSGDIKNNSVLYKDLLLTSTVEGDLYSINSNNGEVLQVVGIGESITSDLSLADIVNENYAGKGVVFGTSEGNIFCYDAFSFEQLWGKNISDHPILSKPAVDKDKIVFLNSTLSLYCVNIKSGTLIWKYEFDDKHNFSAANFPLSDGTNIFSITPDGNLFAVDLLLGQKTWLYSSEEILFKIYLSSDKQNLFTLNSKGLLTIISSKEGKEISKIDFMKSGLFSFCLTESKENIFIGFSDGSLYNIDSKYVVRQLISQTNIPITSINVIHNNELIVKDINGKIAFYKIN